MFQTSRVSGALFAALVLSACGGGPSPDPVSKTAPAISVVPQKAYKTTDGTVNTERVNAVQSSYQQQGARQVGN